MPVHHKGPDRGLHPASDGILEDTRHVELIVRKNRVGSIHGLSEPTIATEDGLSWRTYHHWQLEWEQAAAVFLLGGGSIRRLFDDSYILLGGSHRASFNPRPGMDEVTIAEIWTNVQGLSPHEIFDKLVKHHLM